MDDEEAFLEAMRQAIADSGLSLPRIAERLGDYGITTTGDTVSLWQRGRQRIRPDELFALERTLDVRPGSLSRLLGYVPADMKPARTVPEAIEADPRLTELGRRTLLAAYRAAVRT